MYSIIHLNDAQGAATIHEFARVLSPGGRLLVAFHIDSPRFDAGDTNHLTSWFDRDVELDGYFLDPAGVRALLVGAGFRIEAELLRRPDDAVEYPSRRGCLLARKPCEDR